MDMTTTQTNETPTIGLYEDDACFQLSNGQRTWTFVGTPASTFAAAAAAMAADEDDAWLDVHGDVYAEARNDPPQGELVAEYRDGIVTVLGLKDGSQLHTYLGD